MADDASHVVLKEGYLKKRSRDGSLVTNWRRRYFKLYAGALVYLNTPQDTAERRRVTLSLDTQVTQTNDQGYPLCFVVKASPTAANFYIQAENEEEKAEWATAIFDAARRTADVAAPPPPTPSSPKERTGASPPPPARVLLHMNVVEARGLISADVNGKSDPYCVVSLVGQSGEIIRSEEMKTTYVTDTLDPVWNQHFTIGKSVDLRKVEAIHFELWDHDHVTKNSQLGFIRVPLSVFQMSPASTGQSELVDRWFRVEPPPAATIVPTAFTSALAFTSSGSSSPRRDKEEKEVMMKPHGELHLVMSISGPNLVNFFQSMHLSIGPQSRIVTDGVEHTDNRLEVSVLAAKDLISADFNQSSDPYVELTLLDDKGRAIRGESYTTAVKHTTRNPSWENEHHVFGRICRIDEAAKLRVRVVDWDKHSKNDPLGGVTITLDHLSAHNQTEWFPLEPEPGMAIRENLGAVQLTIALVGETRGERQRRLKIHKEVTSKTHEQSVEQLELENAQHVLHDAACKLDGARIPCAVDDYQARHPQFYGINGCIHHLNTQIPRAHRETTSTDESFQARAGIEERARLEVSVMGTYELPKADTLTASNPYAVIEIDPAICIEECKRTSAPLSPKRNQRIAAMTSAAAESRNAMFSKRSQAEVSSHRSKLAKNEVRSEKRLELSADRPVLKVEVKSGHGLCGVDLGGYSDPYCTLTITDRATGTPVEVEKKKTAVVSKTLNPVWENEVFYFGNNFPLLESAMLLIHVKDHNNIGRSTPLGRVQIPLTDLCHASATSTSISSTAREKRYPLAPEPWMKKHAQNLGELCIKTEVVGDATVLAEILQRTTQGSPEKMLSFLSMSSFSSDPLMSEGSQAGGMSSMNVLSEHEDETTELIEKGKPIRTSTVVGNSAKWRKEKFTLSLSYPGMFSNTANEKAERYTLHLRVFGGRRLMGSHRSDGSKQNRDQNRHAFGRKADTNAYFTIIPVLGNGQLEHQERKQSLTVYGTPNPNWPEQEFVFGKQKDVSLISYLSLHVYTRDLATEAKRPLSQLLTERENCQIVRLKRSLLHKLAPTGEVDDDGLEILSYDQRVLAFRVCGDGGRFFPARVQKYFAFPADEYEVLFEDGIETIDDIWNLFSLDVKGRIKSIHADGTVDVSLITDESAAQNTPIKEIYAKNVSLPLLTPVDGFTRIETVMARRMDARQAENLRWKKLKHNFSGLKVDILSVAGLPKHVCRPGCLLTFLGDPTASSKSSTKSFTIERNGQMKASKVTTSTLWKSGEVLMFVQPFASNSPDVSDLHLFELKSLKLGPIDDDQESTGEIADTSAVEDVIAEGMDIVNQTTSLLIQIVDQGADEFPRTSHPTVGYARIDLAALHNGEQDVNIRLLPPDSVPYYKFVGSLFLHIKCIDAANNKDEVQLKEALKASGLEVADSSLVRQHSSVCGAAAWFERRMIAEQQQPMSPVRALTKLAPKSLTRIARRQLLRASLTPTENAQVDAFHTVLVVITKRIVSVLREIQLFEEFEALNKEDMMKFRHVHTVNADPSSEWVGRLISEMKVEARKDVVVHLEMELLDIAQSDWPRVYPGPEVSREAWVQMRAVRQKELQKVGGFFMQDRTSALVLSIPYCFTGEGMISWMLRAPSILWKDQWVKYCHDMHVRETCKLNWEDVKLELDPDAIQSPRSRQQALIWLSALGDAGFVENVSPSLTTNDAHKKYYLVEDKSDRYFRLREVEMWILKEKREKSLFPLDLVQEVDCYQPQLDDSTPKAASPATSPKSKPESPKSQSPKTAQAPLAPAPPNNSDVLAMRKKTYAKKLLEHVEGYLGTQNVFSSILFSQEVQHNVLLKPVAAKTQQIVAEQLLWDWKYCLFIPSHKSIYMYERETSMKPTIIIDMNSGACHGAFNFAYDVKGGWFDIANATVMQLKSHGSNKFEHIDDDVRDKLMKYRPDGSHVIEFKTSEAQLWVQAFVRAGVRIDMKPGQQVVLKRLNPTVLQEKCIYYVTDFNPNDLEGSFQRLLNKFLKHDEESSHQEHEQKLRDLRAKIRGEVKKSGKVGDTVMAYYGKGQRLNPRPTNERMYTRGALYSGRIVRIRTPFTDAKYRFSQTYELQEAPAALQSLLAKYKIVDKASWLKLPKSLRDLFLLYDIEYRHAHEIIIEEGMIREQLRTNEGDLDPTKVQERCTDLNLLYKQSDLEDCVTRMVMHTGGRKPLGCVKIPIKTVSSHRTVDAWYPLAPENDMVQKANLGQLRVQLRLVETSQLVRSKKVPAALLEEMREAVAKQQIQPFAIAAAAATNPLKFLKDRMNNRSKRLLSPTNASGFVVSKERSFIKLNIIDGRKLIAADYLTSDPFVKIVLVRAEDDKEEFTKIKTDIKSSTLNPKWQNQEFTLGKTEATMLSDKKAIILRVMDHDLTSPDDPMGCLRLEFQRDKAGYITGLVLGHADEKGNFTTRVLVLDEHNRTQVDERLVADEKAGQSKSASARGNNGVTDGKLGKLRFTVEIQHNENFVDPDAVSASKMASMLKSLETKFSLEVAMKKISMAGKAANSFSADWSQFTCAFIPQGEGSQRVYYDAHTEDLGANSNVKMSDLLQSKSMGSAASATKVLGRTFDMSRVAYFDVKLTATSLGKVFNGKFGQQGQFKNPEGCAEFLDEVIILKDKDNKDLEIHITLDAHIVAIHRAERLKRLMAETFRLVGVQFDVRVMNEQVSSKQQQQQQQSRYISDVHHFLWEVGKAHFFPGRNIANQLLAQVHHMHQSSKLHWKFTPQLLGYVLEHVFSFGEKDRLRYEDAVALDSVLNRWSKVLQSVNEAKNQLIGHLHGKETPRLIHSLMTECDWTGFEFASLPSAEKSSTGEEEQESQTESLLRTGTKVHALLASAKHPGVAVDVRLVNGQFVAGTIVAEYGDESFDIAFCTSAKVHDEGDEYFSDEEELPPLMVGQTVVVCRFAQVETQQDANSDVLSSEPGRIGKVDRYDQNHGQSPYLVSYFDNLEPSQEWAPRVYLDSMFQHVVGIDVSVQLAKDDFVRVSNIGTTGDATLPNTTGGGGASRPARVVKNHRNARYDVEYIDAQTPISEKQVPRDRLQPTTEKSTYEGEVSHVYLDVSTTGSGYVVKYDLMLKNGDLVVGALREQLRTHHDHFPSDKAVLASVFFSQLTVHDANSNKEEHLDMATRVNELWAQDQLVKVYVMMNSEPQVIHMRDGASNKLLQSRIPERDEDKPRFADQCHGFVKGENFSDVEASKLAQIFETSAVLQGNTAVLNDADAFNIHNCFCLYMAPQPRVEMHGMLRIAANGNVESSGLFKALLNLAVKDKVRCLQLFQRLLRTTASEHTPLNRRERVVVMKRVDVCFMRKAVKNVSMNALTATCEGELADGDKTSNARMKVSLAHVSLAVVFEINVPHNNRGSLADALSVAHQDASQILSRLIGFNALQVPTGVSVSETMEDGRWSFAYQAVPDAKSLSLEVISREGVKDSRPSLTLELVPLDDQRLSVQDASGHTWDLCIPMDKVLVEAQLRRHLAPYHEAKIIEGPHFFDVEHQQVNKKSRRDSLLLSKPTEPLKQKKHQGAAQPSFRVEYKDSKKQAWITQRDLKFDSLYVHVLRASELSLKDKTGGGDIEIEVLLHSSDFEPQMEGDQALKTPFGIVLNEAGEVCRDLLGNAYPQCSSLLLHKQTTSTEWAADPKSKRITFAYPAIDMTRIAGVSIKLYSRGSKKIIGTTFIPISSIPETTSYGEVSDGAGVVPDAEASVEATGLTRMLGNLTKKISPRKTSIAVGSEQTLSVYRTENGQQTVVGKVKLQIERRHTIKADDSVLAKRFEEEQDSWQISSYELLATTLKQNEDQLMRGLLSTNSVVPNGGRRLLKDPIEQELQLQKISNVMLISHAMEVIYATKGTKPTEGGLTLKDGNHVTSPRKFDQLKHALAQTKWFIEDTAAEFGIRSSGKRLPWSSDHSKDDEGASAKQEQLVVVRSNISNTAVRLRRAMLKLHHMYRHRLIPTLRRLYELDAMGDRIDVKAGEQLLEFFEEEVEDLDTQDQVVYRRVYQRLRLMKIAQVLHQIMQTTLRVTIMDQDPDIGDDSIGTAFIPLLDLLDRAQHDNFYELTKTRKTARGLGYSPRGNTSNEVTVTTVKQGKVHLRIQLLYSESSLLEQATHVYKFLKAKYIVQHENARRRINAAVVPAQRRRWMTIKGYLEELKAQATGKLNWERTPVLLSLVWDIFVTPVTTKKLDEDEEQHVQGLAERANDYRSAVVEVHKRWANLQPKLEELLQLQAATQIHAQRTPQLLQEIADEVEGLDLVLSTAWQQVQQKWMVLFNALEELASMKERNKLHLGRAPQLLHLVTQRCSKGLNERHADAVSNVQFRWMAITQRDGPLCELRLMEKKGLHWRRTHELVLLLNEQCEGFADVDAKALEIVQKRWEQVQEWLDDVVRMQMQHTIDCEATPFILKKMHLIEHHAKMTKESSAHAEKKLLLSASSSPSKTSGSPTRTRQPSDAASPRERSVSSTSGARGAPVDVEVDVGRLEGLAEWYAIEEAKRELERIPYHRITTDYDRSNWLPFSQDGRDTRLIITQQEMALTDANIRSALVDRGVIPMMSSFNGLSRAGIKSPSHGASSTRDSTALPKDLLEEIQLLEHAIENKHVEEADSYVRWNPERVAELYLVIESLGKSDLLWKMDHAVNTNKELEVPTNFIKLLEEMRMRQIPATEIEELVRTLTVTLQKEELAKMGIDVPPNANFTTVLTLMHRHQVKDVVLPLETSAIQTLLQARGMDKKGDPVFLRGMRIGTQSWTGEDPSSAQTKTSGKGVAAALNTGLGTMDSQVEMLRKSLLVEALRKRNSLIKTFPGESNILTEEELSECTEVDMSGDYMTLIERFQQLLIQESYTKRLAEYAALDRCMRALLRATPEQIVTKEDIALCLQSLDSRFRLPLEAFTREELLEAASQGKIRTPTEQMLARCPRGTNAKAMARYAAVSYAAMVFQETVSFRARLDPVTQRFVDAFPYENPSAVDGMSMPKDRSRMNFKQFVVDWLMGSEDSVLKIQRRLGAYHRQRLMWATAAFTLRNRWFHRGFGWCDDVSKGAGVRVLLQKLLVFENANKMHMIATEALLNEVNDKCVNLRTRERQAKESLEQRFYSNLEMLEKLVGHAEKCINNRKLHAEETPALLHAIEQVCVVPNGLNARHKEAYHVVTSHWIPHRARLAELVQMHKEGTFSIERTPELLSAMEFHTEGIAGADELDMDKVVAAATASSTSVEVQQKFVDKKVDEIRRGQRKQSSLRLDLEDSNTDKDIVLEEMKISESGEDNNQWQSLSPSKRVVQPLSPREKQTSWKVVTGDQSSTKQGIVLASKDTTERRRKSSIGDEIKELLRSPSKWLMPASEPEARIRPEHFFPQAVSLELSQSTAQQTPVAAVATPSSSSSTTTTT